MADGKKNSPKGKIKKAVKKIGDAAVAAEHKAEDAVHKIEEAADHAVTAVGEGVVETAEVVIKAEKKVVSMLKDFLHMEASGGIVLVIASIIAIIIANVGGYPFYHYILDEVYFRIGFSDTGGADLELKKSLLHWINDGLMAVFFFLIGLEIKREVMDGELSSRDKILLPAIAAVGGVAVPAAIYWFINKDVPGAIDGWAIPAATDIAFALAILGLLGSRIPTSLKVLLTAIAVIDDLAAILIIALFYSGTINILPLYFAAVMLGGLFLLNLRHVSSVVPYVLLGILLWAAVLESGIHATLAGVVTALFIPLSCKKNEHYSPCKSLMHDLHPWVAFAVLPIFGFANAGVPFSGMGLSDLLDPVTLGIACGLFFGKQIGVFGLMWLTIVTGISPKPSGTNWLQLYAVSILCGIGFTMSLFIGGLAFDGVEMQASVRLGVIIASVASAVIAYVLLYFGCAPKEVKIQKGKKMISEGNF